MFTNWLGSGVAVVGAVWLQVTAVHHASFHASLSQIVKTKVDVTAKDVGGKSSGKWVVAKVKKTTQ